MTDLHNLSAEALSRAYASGELSPIEVAQSVLDHARKWEPHLNALYLLKAEQALAQAKAAETRWARGEALSRLDGVPVTLKENLYTAGDPAPIGVPIGDLSPKSEDSPVGARAREAGLVLIGKTTMPDFGMLSSGLSSLHGTTRNPWRLDLNPAGSSSGAGAAAAAGYGPLHVGTDIGGSIRLPATHCGIFGLKPSLGRIPVDPPFLGRVAGPMTRTVHDSALLLAVLSQPDGRDHMALPPEQVDYVGQLEGLDLKGLRLGLVTDIGVGLAVDPQVRANAQAAASALAAQGAIVEPVPPFLTEEIFDGWCRFFEARSEADLAALSPEARAQILPFIVEWCTWRARDFTGRDLMAAYARIMQMREVVNRSVRAFDFLLSPVSPVPPYAASLHSPSEDPHQALTHIAFTVGFNVGEQPAASINWGYTQDGLPLGVQIVGQRFDDAGVLRLARSLEQLRPVQRHWPTPPPQPAAA